MSSKLEDKSWKELWTAVGSPKSFSPLKTSDFCVCTTPQISALNVKICLDLTRIDYFILKAKGSKFLSRSHTGDGWVLDCTSHFGTLIHGHNNPKIVGLIRNTLRDNTPVAHWGAGEKVQNLCKRIGEMASVELGAPYMCYPNTGSGAEAVDSAITHVLLKASLEGKKDVVIINFEASYHGTASFGALKSSWAPCRLKEPIGKTNRAYNLEVIGIPFDVDKLEETIQAQAAKGKAVAGVILELVQRGAGLRFRPKEGVQKVANLLKQKQIPLIVDEIYTGVWRMDNMLACRSYEIQPEVITMAKSTGAGFTKVGLILSRQDWSPIQDYRRFIAPSSIPSEFFSTIALEGMEMLFENRKAVVEKGKRNIKTIVDEIMKLNDEFPGVFAGVRGDGYALVVVFNFPSISIQTLALHINFSNHHIKAFNLVSLTVSVLENVITRSLEQAIELFMNIDKGKPEDRAGYFPNACENLDKFSWTMFELNPEMSDEDIKQITTCLRSTAQLLFTTDTFTLFNNMVRGSHPLRWCLSTYKACASVCGFVKRIFTGKKKVEPPAKLNFEYYAMPTHPNKDYPALPLPKPEVVSFKKLLKLDVVFQDGVGSKVSYKSPVDGSLRTVVDASSSWHGTILGHNHPDAVKAVQYFLDNEMVNYYAQLISKVSKHQLENALVEFTKASGFDFFSLTCGISETVEFSIKGALLSWHNRVAVKLSNCESIEKANFDLLKDETKSPQPVLLCMEHAYHGTTASLLSICSDYNNVFNKARTITEYIPIGASPEKLREVFAKYQNKELGFSVIVGFLIEPFQVEYASAPLPHESIVELQKLCREHQVPILSDETRTGLYRGGEVTLASKIGLQPDCVMFGTGLGTGLAALGAIGFNNSTYPKAKGFMFNSLTATSLNYSTWANCGLGCAVGLSVLETMTNNAGEIKAKANNFESRLKSAFEGKYVNVIEKFNVNGFLASITFRNEVVQTVLNAFKSDFGEEPTLPANAILVAYLFHQHNIHVQPAHLNHNAVLIQPSYVISDSEIQSLITGLELLSKELSGNPEAIIAPLK